jgi:hypothetical protein
MKAKRLQAGLQALAATALIVSTISVRAETRVLPFQGRLTDANGNALLDGSRVVQFKIYDAPVGGRAVWNGEVHNLTVNSGLVSTLLGTKATLAGVDFNQDLYLELTIDANGDGQITLADPPLLPRQSILPAVFARESANTRLLGGYDWSPLFGTNNPADGTLLDSKIGDGSLASSKIRDAAITSAKIADGAVLPSKLGVTGASAGQSLLYDGTNVTWSPVHAVTADNAANATFLKGFDWSSIFSGGNPQSGSMSVASLSSRGSVSAAGVLSAGGNLVVNGTTFLYGSVVAPFMAASIFMTDNSLYLRNSGDYNHYLTYANDFAGQSGFDGPLLVGVGGGMLGSTVNWTLRWYNTGEVVVRSYVYANGVRLTSDRNLKENFAQADARAVLDKVLTMPVTMWNFKTESKDQKHIGPVAQDFQAAFQLDADDKHISLGDEVGIALAAIQGLNNKVEENGNELRKIVKGQQEQIETLKAEIAALKAARR